MALWFEQRGPLVPQWCDSRRARRCRHRAPGADRGGPRARARRCRRSRYRADCDTTRSNACGSAAPKSQATKCARGCKHELRAHCRAAASSASRLMSVPTPVAFGSSLSSASSSAPEPVPRSAMRSARWRGPPLIDRGERRFHHGLGFRPRHQRGGGDAKRQAPEFLDARECAPPARGRAAVRPARDQPPRLRRRGDRGSPRHQRRCDRGRARGRSAGARRARALRDRRGGTHRSARAARRRRSCRMRAAVPAAPARDLHHDASAASSAA